MPRIIIDTDLLAESLKEIDVNGRGDYLLKNLREIHKELEHGMSLPVWAEQINKKENKGASVGGYSPAFLKFWEVYPSRNGVRTGKAQAMKCWKKVKGLSEAELLKACLAALEWQKKDGQWIKDRGVFIPMAATYLKQRRWEDEGSPNHDEWEEYTDMNGAIKKRRKT